MSNPPLRIWFNRTFATSYWLLRQLKENPENVQVQIFATHVDANSPVLAAADVSGQEPDVDGEEYVAWALDFCERNDIRLLVPRAHQLELTQAATRFEAIGVTLVSPPAETVATFDDKDVAYKAAAMAGLTLPPYRTVQSSRDLLEAHAALTGMLGSGAELVLKPAVGVGAEGFRILTPRALEIADVLATKDQQVRLPQVVDALIAAELQDHEIPKLMLMPLLGNPETSLDVLTSPDGKLLSALARVKQTPRLTRFLADEDAYWQAEQLHATQRFAYISNFQFMRWQEQNVLLEVNTRPAGGLFAAEATGINYPWEAIRLALGKEPRELKPELGGAFAQVHAPVMLPGI